ncbi:hypothetical protein [Reyranella sp.]|uniref:hypothetical protein n=1 Tax=Reyranella sp. TaxID=1929291 RepID=UPI003D103593
MARAEIPKQVRRFIAKHIDSVGELEALLLLRSAPEEVWDVPRIMSRLYIDEAETTRILDRLCRSGFLVLIDKRYEYRCRTQDLQQAVDAVAEFYARHLIPITNMIHAKSRRIREFADAFRFRKDS